MSYNGNRECFALPRDFDPAQADVETCSTTTWIQLNLHLLELTGQARYAAEAERAVFNSLMAAQYGEGIDWCYYTKANQDSRPYATRISCCASSGPRARKAAVVEDEAPGEQAAPLPERAPVQVEPVEEEPEAEEGPKATYIYEPAPEEILNQLMPMFVNVQIMAAMLETVASEMAARMTSMDNATNACNDIIQELTLVYNKARQSAITAELMDIVGGAEALKG